MRPKLPRKPSITAQEWERIREESQAAKELLDDPRFSFLRDYLHNAQASIVDHFVRNRIKGVKEEIKVSDSLTKTLTITRREQEYELSGQYKFIESLLSDLKQIAAQEEEYRKAAEAKRVTIEGDPEKE